MSDALELLRELVAEGPDTEFRPFAYYDKHLDCIRVQFFDCSFTERRLNRFLTVLKANSPHAAKHAGFNIKGVRSLFERLGYSQTQVVKLTQLLDRLSKLYPDAAIASVLTRFGPLIDEGDLQVSLVS